ncbi:hypothetical protein EYF80_040903 [Liparis tanakae]|uniref:Uncharacterized protein n=1 Tax=Liparis tanakae TaxID=230148 RepID=A0A4Z2G6X9_9TELE|nr:hypothetical protein EYF80_040903 [Liparis tanakae]
MLATYQSAILYRYDRSCARSPVDSERQPHGGQGGDGQSVASGETMLLTMVPWYSWWMNVLPVVPTRECSNALNRILFSSCTHPNSAGPKLNSSSAETHITPPALLHRGTPVQERLLTACPGAGAPTDGVPRCRRAYRRRASVPSRLTSELRGCFFLGAEVARLPPSRRPPWRKATGSLPPRLPRKDSRTCLRDVLRCLWVLLELNASQ